MAEAVFQGTFAQVKPIAGRKVYQFIIEVPMERADAALKAMGGLPNPEESRWVAVARLVAGPPPTAAAPLGPAKSVNNASPSPSLQAGTTIPQTEAQAEAATAAKTKSEAQRARERCVMLCKESAFDAWIRLKRGPLTNGKTTEQIVRDALGCNSRADIETNPQVFQRWKQIDGAYRDYQRYGDRP